MDHLTRSRSLLAIGLGISLTSLTVYLIAKLRKRKQIKWEHVGRVLELTIHPVKSMRGIPLSRVHAGRFGPETSVLRDRSFVVYTEDGVMVTGRTAPMMTTMTPTVSASALTIRDLDGDEVTVDTDLVAKNNQVFNMRMRDVDSCGLNCGNEVAEWLTERLFEDKRKVVLLYCGSLDVKRKARKPIFLTFPQYKETDKILYSDTASYMVQTTASLEDLNSKLAKPVTMARYRPSIVVAGPTAWDEDNWSHIKIGDKVVLRAVKPCERCLLTTMCPETGEHDPAALECLTTYRTPTYPPKLAKEWKTKPVMGVQCCIDACDVITLGDEVQVLRQKVRWWGTN